MLSNYTTGLKGKGIIYKNNFFNLAMNTQNKTDKENTKGKGKGMNLI